MLFFGTGMIVDDLRQEGTTPWARDRLNSFVRIGVSWSAQSLSTRPGIPSGPAAFLGFTAFSAHLTSCSVRTVKLVVVQGADECEGCDDINSGWVGDGGERGGRLEEGEVGGEKREVGADECEGCDVVESGWVGDGGERGGGRGEGEVGGEERELGAGECTG